MLEHVLSPIQINKMVIKNRIVRAAHGTYLGKGVISDELVAYHEARAKAGIGLSILEATSVHKSSALVGLAAWQPNAVSQLSKLATALHRYDSKMFVQLFHGGHRYGPAGGRAPWGPSATPCPVGPVNTPFAMTIEQIGEMIESFAVAARKVQESGLDGVEIHFGHDYLIHQFLSPMTNKRTDEYGGDLDNRMRFGRDILLAARAAVGPDFPIGIRLSDFAVPGGLTAEEAGEIARKLCAEGLIDYLSASMGSHYNGSTMLGAMDMPAGYMLDSALTITKHVNVPTMVAGAFRTLAQAEDLIREGRADMVSFVRALIADPDLVTKTVAGQADRVRPCIMCNQGCVAGVRSPFQRMLCTVNPAVGEELTWGENLIEPANSPQKVVVIGGGPGGMEAARVAASQGHAVVLFEARSHLGGVINIARRAPNLAMIGDATDWLERELHRLGVDVRTSTYVGANAVLDEHPDQVVVATGALPRMDGVQAARPGHVISGFDQPHVISSHALFDRPTRELGSSALVFDDVGHYEAISVAEYLVDLGLKVTFVTRHSAFSPQMEAARRTEPALRRLRQGDFKLHIRSRLVGVQPGYCELGYLEGEDVWREPADTVVFISNNNPQNDLYRALGGGSQRPLPYTLRLIGDAQSPRDMLMAIREGHFAMRTFNDQGDGF